ncbi:MAG: hypothetical protein Q9167_003187 [Letrouitia subvulpina]
MAKDTMKAVVFKGPQKGHEFTGTVEEVGSAVESFKKGDPIVSPFTVSCQRCFYCKNGYSSRCSNCQLFGTRDLDGAQAEYVRIPLADATLVKAPEEIAEYALVLMADIFPTGYFAGYNAFKELTREQIADSVVVLVGCGPVGLCALVNVEDYKPKHILAVDSVPSRLELAKSLGAEPWNFQTDREGLDKRVQELTDGRGADVRFAVIGIGSHFSRTGNEAYGKNLRIQMGRCPVRSIFPQSLEKLKQKQHLLR